MQELRTAAPLPRLTGEEDLPDELPLPPGFRGWLTWVFRVPNHPNPRRRGDIVRWWERRRLAYNLIVGASGIIPFIVLVVVTATRPVSPTPWYFYVLLPVIAGILMNICYTAGWIVESVGFTLGFPSRKIGPVLLITGLLLSFLAILAGVP